VPPSPSQGVLGGLRLAFSRDTAKKVYIQHLMTEDGAALANALAGSSGGSFYLCGPMWPESDVEAAITAAFDQHAPPRSGGGGGAGAALVRALKDAKRYVLEVY